MDKLTAQSLIALNKHFYASHAASFSATRNAPWEGWSHVVLKVKNIGALSLTNRIVRVLDLACGNLRFEHYLASELPDLSFEFQAFDATPALADTATKNLKRLHFCQLDILTKLLQGHKPLTAIPLCNLSVCFGFMHHVPGKNLQQELLQTLVDQTCPGGVIALSFWQFMNDKRLAEKAQATDARAARVFAQQNIPNPALDSRDHFLGWQDDASALRYCHHFEEDEIDTLVKSVQTKAHEVSRFSADGRTGTLNRYVVLQRM